MSHGAEHSDVGGLHNDKAKGPLVAALIDECSRRLRDAHAEMGKVLFGQDEVISQVLIAMLAGGHMLAEGVPGTGKTRLVSNVSKIMGLDWKRIQFTADLLPSAILGYEKEDTGSERGITFVKGPIDAQCVLADEINRASPKTQSALLEAMQERKVTFPGSGFTHVLPRPFFVMATQNPLENDGTYPLPEAQLDRFMFKVKFGYPKTAEIEEKIVTENSGTKTDVLEQFAKVARGEKLVYAPDPNRESGVREIVSADELIAMQDLARVIPIPRDVMGAMVGIVRRARPGEPDATKEVNEYLEWGPSVRASEAFAQAAQARALMEGRYSVGMEDIRAVAEPILAHRMKLNYRAAQDKVTAGAMVSKLVAGL